MICPKCKFEQPDGATACSRCGIVFEKYLSQQRLKAAKAAAEKPEPALQGHGLISRVKNFFLYVHEDVNPFYFGGRAVFFLIIFVWGVKFMLRPMESNYAGQSFLHLANLPFHEAGHIIFRPFGRFMTMLGGSLMQLLVPLACLLTFLIKNRDNFAASVTLWWLGESALDLAPYINDARSLNMVLLGGVTGRDVADYHDWEFILRKLGLLRYDHSLALTAQTLGIVLMLTALAWGGTMLYRQFRRVLSDLKAPV